MQQVQTSEARITRATKAWLVLTLALLTVSGCAPAVGPTSTALTTIEPTQLPTAAPQPTPTQSVVRDVEGLVMIEEGQVIIGVDWLSKSRVTYRVTAGDLDGLRALEGETAVVQGEVTDLSEWVKEIVAANVRVSAKPGRLCRRIGFIKELGISLYMQGTHVLTDREGGRICLLSSDEGGPDLDQYMLAQVAVIGVLEHTVEGNEQIMKVQRVEKVK